MNITNYLSNLKPSVSQAFVCVLRKLDLVGLRQEVHYYDLFFLF